MKLSVVIPCYNGEETLAEQLEGLATQAWSGGWELILSDNGSTDNSRAVASAFADRFPEFRIVDASERRGQPFAINTGVLAASGDAVIFCDADDVAAPGWLQAMGEYLEHHDFVAGSFETQRLNPPWIASSHGNPQKSGLNKYSHPPYLEHAGGGNMGVKRSIFLDLGGFDEGLPLLHDTDFCWRAQRKGVGLVFCPEAIMHIRYRDTARGLFHQALRLGEYNVILYKRYRAIDMPPISLKRSLQNWWRLIKGAPFIYRRRAFMSVSWQAGWCFGRIIGSFKHRVLAP